MKELRFRHIASEEIAAPFTIRTQPYKASESLTATLCTLFPHRAAQFMHLASDTLFVSDRVAYPFGPGGTLQKAFFFDTVETAVQAVQKQYETATIQLHGAGAAAKSAPLSESSHVDVHEAVSLSLEEFHALYRAVCHGEKVTAQLCSIFLDYDNVFTLFVPRGTTLKRIFSKVKPVARHVKENPSSTPYHPITGHVFELDEPMGFATTHISFSESGYVLSPGTGPLFAFPYFNRTLAMIPGRLIHHEQHPCNNCLTCSRFCPAGIMPSYLYHNITRDNQDEAERLGLKLCIQCGICRFVCPASLPLYSTITGALLGNTADAGG